jgi:hypothetical protein
MLDCEHAHSGHGARGAFFSISRILAEGNFLVCVESLEASDLFLVTLEPDCPIRMQICKSLKKGLWTFFVQIQSTDKGCYWVEHSLLLRNGRTKKGVRNMARKENSFNTKVNPRRRQVWERNAPILLALIHVGIVNKSIDSIAKAKKTFMVLPFMLISDL